jgi:photosystem II stability/assembly factor-like uncharacterized protein
VRPRRLLALAALAALVAGVAALAVDRVAAPASVPATTAAGAALARSAELLAAGEGVVWAQIAGDVYRSDDGGRRFRADLPAAARAARCGCEGPAFFFGPRDAWVVRSSVTGDGAAQQATVWLTTDGGRTWRDGPAVPGLPSPMSVALLSYSLSFATPEVGYLLGSGTDLGSGSSVAWPARDQGSLVSLLWKTSDGGRTWRHVVARGLPGGSSSPGSPTACDASIWLAVSFANARLGFVTKACASGPDLWESTDGGRDWTRADFERPPGGWPEYAQFGLPSVTADGTVLDSASGIDPATNEDGWLVVERLGPGGSFRYIGRVQTDSLGTTSLDPVGPAGSRLAVVVAGRLLSEGVELFESSDGGARWRLAGHEPQELVGSRRKGASPPSVTEGSVLAVLAPTGGRPTVGAPRPPGPGALLLNPGTPATEGQGTGGTVDSTNDSGRIWHQVLAVAPPPAAEPPYDDVAFATERTGYLAGPAGVAVTTDGGAHIVPVLRLGSGERVLALDATGRSGAVVVTTRRLLVTADIGRRWRARREPPGSTALEAVDFVSARIGFATSCDRNGVTSLERTLDGGRTWQALAVPAGSGCGLGPPLCVVSARVLYDLVVPAVATVGGAGSAGPLDATLYASGDGGGSWRRVGPAPGTLLACSGPTLWADTSANPGMNFEPYVVFRSRDGGRSFAAVAGSVARTAPYGGLGGPYPAMNLTNGELYALVAVGPGAAVLMTDCGACQQGSDLAVSVTTDGGSAWSAAGDVLAAGLPNSSLWASFVSPRAGFVLAPWSQGPGNVLVATSDGGRSWHQLAVLGAGG